MRVDRTSARGRSFVGVSLGVILVASLGAAGCTPYSTFRNVSIDCDIEARYQFDPSPINLFDMVGDRDRGWTSTDGSLGSVMAGEVKAMTDGARCNSTAALVITAENNNDWGSLFGLNNFDGPRDESAYEGMSFWARAPGNSNRAFTILLDDPNTLSPTAANCAPDAGVPPPQPSDASVCRNYCNSDGGTSGGTTDPGTGMFIPGTVGVPPKPDQCGNSYSVVRLVTADWRLHTIPFSEFVQGATPNRVPNPALTQTGAGTRLRTSQLLNLIIRMPKAVRTELWIDDLGFYRKATANGGDGGADVPRL